MNPEFCTTDIPVKFGDDTTVYYLHPLTKVIQPFAEKVECDYRTAPKFKFGGKLWKMIEGHIIEEHTPLSNFHHNYKNAAILKGFSNYDVRGVYGEEMERKHKTNLEKRMAKKAVINDMAHNSVTRQKKGPGGIVQRGSILSTVDVDDADFLQVFTSFLTPYISWLPENVQMMIRCGIFMPMIAAAFYMLLFKVFLTIAFLFCVPKSKEEMRKQGKIKYLTKILCACIRAVFIKPLEWLHALIAQVTSDAESLSSLGSEEDLQSIGAKSPYSDQEINRTINDHANSLIHVLSEFSKLTAKTEQLNDEVSDLKQRLQDDSSDESNSENED